MTARPDYASLGARLIGPVLVDPISGVHRITVEIEAGDMPTEWLALPHGTCLTLDAHLGPHDDGSPTLPVVPDEGTQARLQSVLLAKDRSFQRWVAGQEKNGLAVTETAARNYIRKRCGVRSRGEIATNADARARWYRLLVDYRSSISQSAWIPALAHLLNPPTET